VPVCRHFTLTTHLHPVGGRAVAGFLRPVPELLAPATLLLVDGTLSGRESLEARVGNWLAALDGESISPGRKPCLGPLKRRELFSEVLGETCVELMLVKVLRASVARFVLFRSSFGILVGRTRVRLANSVPLALEELAGAIKIHGDRVSLDCHQVAVLRTVELVQVSSSAT
jgi:hypothetical protein